MMGVLEVGGSQPKTSGLKMMKGHWFRMRPDNRGQ